MMNDRPKRWARQRLLVRVVLTTALAALALAVTQGWFAAHSVAATSTAVPGVDILVTARPVAAGSVLTAADVRWQLWPARAVAAGWIRRGTSAPPIGRVAPQALAAGVPLTASLLVATGPGSAFAAAIRPGWRAISIAVGPAAGLAGFVTPGDRVDVLLTHSIGNRRTAQTLITDIGVLGVDQRQRGDAGTLAPMAAASDVIASATAASGAAPPDLVTLEVTPQQAQALTIAAELGKLSLILRGPGPEAVRPGSRRWDSEITGLSPALLAAGSNPSGPAAASILPPPVSAPVASAPAGGIEIVYGLPAAAAPPPAEAAK